MDAVILAGGYGTRLRPLTYTRPKPLIEVAGKPMVEHVLDRLPAEVERVVVAVNWLADELEAYFDGSGRDVDVVREQEPLGTGGAVLNCKDHLTSDAFFVLNADIVSDMDLAAMAQAQAAAGGAGTIALKEVPEHLVRFFGVVGFEPTETAGTNGSTARRIATFVEKPQDPAAAPSRMINAGAYLLSRDVLDLIPPGRLVSMEKEIFPQLLPKGLYGWEHQGTWVDVGDPARLREATHALDADFRHGPGAALGEDVVWKDTIAGRNVRVGDGSRLERCVLGHDVDVAPESVLVDCIVGDGERVAGALAGERVWTRPVPEQYPQAQVGNAL